MLVLQQQMYLLTSIYAKQIDRQPLFHGKIFFCIDGLNIIYFACFSKYK